MPLDAQTPPAPPAMKDWHQATQEELVAHLLNHHHAFARRTLARLGPVLKEALDHQNHAHPELSQVTVFFRELEQDLLAHFRMEENNLFPAILAMKEGGPVPISLSTPKEQYLTIQAEHQAVEELFLNIRMVTSDYEAPSENNAMRELYLGLQELEDDLHKHLYLENHLLFPRILPTGKP